MKKINTHQNDINDINETEKDIVGIERIDNDDEDEIDEDAISQKRYQRILTICLIMICITFLIYALRFINHNKILKQNTLPSDAAEVMSIKDDDKKDVEKKYINEVTYNPTKMAEIITNIQNKRDLKSLSKYKLSLWYDGISKKTSKKSKKKSKNWYAWEFCSDHDYKGADIDCLWICRDQKTKDILAITTGVYNGENDSFDNEKFSTIITRKGSSQLDHD